MSEWAQRDAAPPRIVEWLHVATGVELFVAEHDEGYGAHIRAPESASIDTVSIGDPETGEFERFEERDDAVAYTDDWKESEAVLKALESGDETPTDVPGDGGAAGGDDVAGEDVAGEDVAGDDTTGDDTTGDDTTGDDTTGDDTTGDEPPTGEEPTADQEPHADEEPVDTDAAAGEAMGDGGQADDG